MEIIRISSKSRKLIKQFTEVPFKLYQNTPQWVPPVNSDIRRIFHPDFAFNNYGEAAFYLAKDDHDQPVGRIAVANNHRYNDFNQTKTAFFYYFETIDDLTIAEALFSQAFDWAKSQGLNHILGPKGLIVLDGFGMLVNGFEHQQIFGQPYNPPYYPKLVETLGFTKVKDILTSRIDRSTQFPEKMLKAADLIRKRFGFRSPKIKTKRELRKVINNIKILYNDSLAEPAGNPPITDADLNAMVSQLLWIADPRLVKILYKDDRPVGWMLGYPDISAALQETKGRLYPFGWLRILQESKRTNRIVLNGIGIIEQYQRLGGTAILLSELYKSLMEDDRYSYAELLQMREENINIFLEAARFNVDFHKIHRLYEKYL